MKWLLFLLLTCPAWAEPPDYAKTINSSKEYVDVKPDDDWSGSLQIVVDKYSLLGAFADGTFRPRERLLRGEVAGWLDHSAKRAEELVTIVSENFKGDKFQFRQQVRPNGRQPKAEADVYGLKDLPDEAPCYEVTYHLAHRYFLSVKARPDKFGAEDPVTAEEFSDYLRALFHYKNGPKGKQPLTRGEAVDTLCDAFQFYLDEVDQKMGGK